MPIHVTVCGSTVQGQLHCPACTCPVKTLSQYPARGVQGLRFLQLCKYRLWSLQSLNATACKHSGKNSSGAPLAWWGGFLTPFSTYHITLLCTPSMGGQTNRHTDRHQSTGGLLGANLTPNMFDSSRQAMTASWGSCAIIGCYEEKGSVAVHHS
jgi:hypothetical protein